MRIFVDENIPNRTVEELRKLGHDVLDIRGSPDQGMADDALWARLLKEHRLLVTTDKGFAQHRGESHYGILIVRLRQPNEMAIHEKIMHSIRRFNEQEWPGLLIVMRDAVQSISRSDPG